MLSSRAYTSKFGWLENNASIELGKFCINNDKHPTNPNKEYPKNYVKSGEMKQEQVLHMSFHVARFSPLSMEYPHMNIFITASGLDQ